MMLFSVPAMLRAGFPVRQAVFAIEAGLAAAIVASLGGAIFLIAAPLPPPPAAAEPGGPAPTAFYSADPGANPFRGAAPDAPFATAPLQESALNIVLYGTWRGSPFGGAAALSVDGAAQRKIAVGEEIAAGVRLADVQDEYVVIDNQGVREAVPILNRRIDLAAALSGPPAETLDQPPPVAAGLRDGASEATPALAPAYASEVIVTRDDAEPAVPDDED